MYDKSVFNITSEGIRHYLSFWKYSGIWFDDVDNEQFNYLREIVPDELLSQAHGDDVLQVGLCKFSRGKWICKQFSENISQSNQFKYASLTSGMNTGFEKSHC